MKVKATKTMASAIQKAMPNGYCVTLEKMCYRAFSWYVSANPSAHEIDYNSATEKFSVLRVCYPDEFHACDAYLTTKDLTRIFRRSDKTLEGFLKALREEIEI